MEPSQVLFFALSILVIIMVVITIDYFLIRNSYRELGKSIDKIFDKAGKIALIAFILSLFKGTDDNNSS